MPDTNRLKVFVCSPLSEVHCRPLTGSTANTSSAAKDTRPSRLIAEMSADGARRLLDGEDLINQIDRVNFY